MDNTNNIIEFRHITKTFPGIIACNDISLDIRKGEIHALLGENGAGKSTLMSVLFGMYQPEAGEIIIRGKPTKVRGPREATALGIGMVHQHFQLVENYTVLKNIILGQESMKGPFLDLASARKKVVELSEKYGLQVDPDALISDITVGQQQRVEILKMLYRNAEILIFDEPTAVLTPQDIDELMKIMKGLAKEGHTLLFISHKLDEIKRVADRVTILRHGKYIQTCDCATVTTTEMGRLMVGREVSFSVDKGPAHPTDDVLKVENLTMISPETKKTIVNHINFNVRRGEIVCIAGIDGNGQSEIIYGLTGIMPINEGKIELNGKDITKASIRERNLGVLGHIPEDRHKYGLVLDYSLAYNLALKNYFKPGFQKLGFLNFDRINTYADELIEKYDVRSGQGKDTIARSMSGGNQQKAIVAREIDQNPDLLIAVQPTRGLDVGAIENIHKHLVAQRDAGKGVLLMSFELDEVMDVSDRILVVYEGEIMGDLNPKEVTVEEVGLYMAGVKRQEAAK
ncbi:MAG: ABC transporter ATP-binding protein [Erysipelotrichales bacterium]|nr:ABC transporter ATP-binding protein [Erysipelotrichales bacterium]